MDGPSLPLNSEKRNGKCDPFAVDIIVPVHDQVDMTRNFLESLKRCTTHPFRLILVDNGSKELPDSLIDGFEDALLIRNSENLGFAGGCNAGLRAGDNPLVAVLNNDLILTRGWLDRMVKALMRESNIAAAAPLTNYSAGYQQVDIAPYADEEGMHERARAFTERNKGRIEDIDFATGMCLLMRRDVLSRMKGFDERFGKGNFEDNDLCLRLKNKGLRIVLALDVFIYHLGNRTFQSLKIDYEKQLRRNEEIFHEKWKDDPYVEGCRLHQSGDLVAALKSYLKALQGPASNPEPLFRIGVILLEQERFEAAAKAFRQHLKACPESTRSRIGIAQALLRGERPHEGAALLRAVLRGRYLKEKDREALEKMVEEASLMPSKEPANT